MVQKPELPDHTPIVNQQKIDEVVKEELKQKPENTEGKSLIAKAFDEAS